MYRIICLAIIAFVVSMNAKTLTEDMVVKQVDINDYIAVTSKITGINIMNAENIQFNVSTMVKKGKDTSELIAVLKEVLAEHSYTLVEVDGGYIIKRKKTYAKVLYTSGSVDRIGEILKQRAFLTKAHYNRDVFVSGDKESQSLTVVGTTSDLANMSAVFFAAEIKNRKVILEAKIVELSSDNIRKVGIQYGMVTAGDNSGDVLRKLSNRQIEDNQLKTQFAVGGGDGASALSATLNFLASTGSVYILEEPSIEVNSGQESELYSGNTIYVQDRVDKNGVAGYTKTDVGLRLTVKPYITNDGKVNLDITILAENKVGNDSNGKPIITKKKLHTTTTVEDRRSVILGSLSKSDKSETSKGIPWLKDVPIVGWMFGVNSSSESSKTMLIILKAYIVKSGTEQQVRDAIEEDKRYQAMYSSKLYEIFVDKKQNNEAIDVPVNKVGKQREDENMRLHNERLKEIFDIDIAN